MDDLSFEEQNNAAELKSLGQGKTEYPLTYCPTLLEKFINKFPNNEYVVKLLCPEFTSLCPKTRQPDFATIEIDYSPDQYLVESKSLKLYLFSYRNHGAFHENCVNQIAQDLYALLSPKWIEVVGKFGARGGISIVPKVRIVKTIGGSI